MLGNLALKKLNFPIDLDPQSGATLHMENIKASATLLAVSHIHPALFCLHLFAHPFVLSVSTVLIFQLFYLSFENIPSFMPTSTAVFFVKPFWMVLHPPSSISFFPPKLDANFPLL